MWIAKNGPLTVEEMENNANMVWGYFGNLGCSVEGVSAMLGNMQSESGINPGRWQNDIPFPPDPNEGGYGLTQWTPYTKYSDWAGTDWENNGDKQCERIIYEAENGKQWFANEEAPIVEPPITLMEFLHSDLAPATLANYFLWYYEHPQDTIQPERGKQAERWYEFLTGKPPKPPAGRSKRMPVYFYLRHF